MAILDITSLSSNIPLEETLSICLNESLDRTKCISNLYQSSFEKLLFLATKEAFFIFDITLYIQQHSEAMGSSLGPTLANLFLCYYEKNTR